MALRIRRPERRPCETPEGTGGGECPTPARSFRSHAGQDDPCQDRQGKLLSPARRRVCVDHVIDELKVSERRACRVLGLHRSTQRKIAQTPDDEAALTADITALTLQYDRYGYRRITAMLHQAGWVVNVKRVERIWRRAGLKVPHKQPKRSRLWLNRRPSMH